MDWSVRRMAGGTVAVYRPQGVFHARTVRRRTRQGAAGPRRGHRAAGRLHAHTDTRIPRRFSRQGSQHPSFIAAEVPWIAYTSARPRRGGPVARLHGAFCECRTRRRTAHHSGSSAGRSEGHGGITGGPRAADGTPDLSGSRKVACNRPHCVPRWRPPGWMASAWLDRSRSNEAGSGLRQGHALLALVFTAHTIPVRRFAFFVRLEKQHLRDTPRSRRFVPAAASYWKTRASRDLPIPVPGA